MPLPWPEHERVGKDLGRVRNQCEDESHDSQCRRPLATRLHLTISTRSRYRTKKPPGSPSPARRALTRHPVRRGVRGRTKQQIISTVGDTAYRLQRCRICVQRTQHPLYRPRVRAHQALAPCHDRSDACAAPRAAGPGGEARRTRGEGAAPAGGRVGRARSGPVEATKRK